ncbi:MAG: DUF998 domain-containing protein [archaeon]|uniref:Uncharacterized protein DUF998 n=1 Tax=Methanobrevibacter gottschalkii DSM 11977 TaxID=1122229 RepID=A0A3N5BWH3_9EURY|nr:MULTISPECIES: DUF998 domain-containing protein [Methanobrevibacter]MCQ2970410.1 DUF998 domain-containing protein [archaeon]OED01032.1 hypothetical protein A9505_02515 [Methanobrevibacter sp. A27]RPF50225.1 uncharacterized protein DUF998 [Methanobrevibacter gottschalkii DSM 11977]
MRNKVAGIVFIVGSLYYVLAEAVSATFFNASLFNTYSFHTISELGIPNVNSPLFWLMNSAFILIGLTLIFGNFYKFKDFLVKNRIIIYILTLMTSTGVIMVGWIHGGNPFTLGYHMLGAMMAIFGGNVLLIVISRSMSEYSKFQKTTLVLGIFGLAVFWIMFFNMESIYMPVFERLSVYTMIIWCFLTGCYIISRE